MSPASRARPSTAWVWPRSKTSSASSTASRSATTSSTRKCWTEVGRVRATTTFSQTLTFVVGLLCLEKRVSYRRLQLEFGLDDETLDDVRHELIVRRLAIDENGEGLFFVGAAF